MLRYLIEPEHVPRKRWWRRKPDYQFRYWVIDSYNGNARCAGPFDSYTAADVEAGSLNFSAPRTLFDPQGGELVDPVAERRLFAMRMKTARPTE